jgi:hypothetical protein
VCISLLSFVEMGARKKLVLYKDSYNKIINMTIQGFMEGEEEIMRLDVFPLYQLPAHVVKVIGYDKGGIAFSGMSFNWESFHKSSMCRLLERVRGEVEGIKCETGRDPFPRDLNEVVDLSLTQIDECLKFAGRINYNKALQEIKDLLNSYITELK